MVSSLMAGLLLANAEPRSRMAVQRIAFCHLESLTCLPAINRLFLDLGDKIGLVVVSRRFGPKHGNMLHQFVANVRRSGLPMTLALGFDLVSAQIVARIALGFSLITRRRPFLEALPELARRSGANLVRTADINSESMVATLKEYSPDIIIVMNFDQILKSAVIATPRIGVINIHPSLLPDFRGPCPVFWALAENRKKSGVSLHLIKDTMIDAGPVLVSIERGIDKMHSVAEIGSVLFVDGAAAAARTIEQLAAGINVGQEAKEGLYRGFPESRDVAKLRRSGVGLWRVGHAVQLIAAATSLKPWRYKQG